MVFDNKFYIERKYNWDEGRIENKKKKEIHPLKENCPVCGSENYKYNKDKYIMECYNCPFEITIECIDRFLLDESINEEIQFKINLLKGIWNENNDNLFKFPKKYII